MPKRVNRPGVPAPTSVSSFVVPDRPSAPDRGDDKASPSLMLRLAKAHGRAQDFRSREHIRGGVGGLEFT